MTVTDSTPRPGPALAPNLPPALASLRGWYDPDSIAFDAEAQLAVTAEQPRAPSAPATDRKVLVVRRRGSA